MTAIINKKRILVINRNYQAVTTITLRRAIRMLCKDVAVIVLPPDQENVAWQELTWDDWSELKPKDGEDVIRAAKRVFKIPEIIRLEEYGRVPFRQVKLSRRAIYKRDRDTCQYCGCQPGTEELSIDHVVPKSQGGKTEWHNVVLACVKCNRKKANKSLKDCGMKLRTVPKMPDYDILQGREIRVDSWQHFLGDMYWTCPLKD